ncbi:hypothetical protein [Variovorax atrisoli]|uniref:hypothetical protein n=1 Tax=Variovorax atrisoli TaxID=3394203 RepID=UPI00339A9139
MRPNEERQKVGEGEEQEFMLDEAFLQGVDRAMQMTKQFDPYRLKEAWRAAEEESRLASMTDVYGLERRRLRREN